jgi:hypothetical protein
MAKSDPKYVVDIKSGISGSFDNQRKSMPMKSKREHLKERAKGLQNPSSVYGYHRDKSRANYAALRYTNSLPADKQIDKYQIPQHLKKSIEKSNQSSEQKISQTYDKR